MEPRDSCKLIMLGYLNIYPKLCMCTKTLVLPNLGLMICPYISYVLDCWEEPSLSPGMPKKTLSHIWLRLYLPMFWFNVGLFTLVKMDSLNPFLESIFIRVNNPTLNQNIGKYNLNHIWDRVLFDTPGLKLGSSQQSST